MPLLKTEIPEWFDHVCTQEIPLLWARRKFPIVALALVFKKLKGSDSVAEYYGAKHWSTVSLHLFIDGQEVCSKKCHYFNVGDDHVLICDLRVLFNDEEWRDL
ncbi:disease resistance protein (TIR-NBS-LRR class), partial [Trifolium pratense]